MKRILASFYLSWAIWGLSLAFPQDKPKSYSPTEVQTLRLQVRQKDAQLAQRDLQFAQQRFQQSIQDLNAEADKIKTENKWPAGLSFSPDTLTFSEPPKPAEKK